MSIQHLVRPNIRNLKPYSSARSEFKGAAEVFLDANENPFESGLNRYPDPLQQRLKGKIAEYKGVQPEQLFLGNGSDEAIDLLIRIFCEPGKDQIIINPPTYGMYHVSADIADVGVLKTPLTARFQPDIASILEAARPSAKLLFLCSPNNPTGNEMEVAAVRSLLDQFQGIVIIDEAYIDFTERASFIRWLEHYPRLVVMQTFSKAWGLAGIRLGMAYANPEIIDLLNRVKPPYNLNTLTQQAALKALADPNRMKNECQKVLQERARLEDQLPKFSFVREVLPSSANFLLTRVEAPDQLYRFLVERRIIVRNRSQAPGCEGSLRFTVGRPGENDRLLEALQQFQNTIVAQQD